MQIALAQINPTVGDVDGNTAKVAAWIARARARGADLVLFPELCVPGYPAEDLYLKSHFLAASRRAVEEIAEGVSGIVALVGFAEPAPATPVRGAPITPSPSLSAATFKPSIARIRVAQLRGLRRAALLHPGQRSR